jgi:hypothetical protein
MTRTGKLQHVLLEYLTFTHLEQNESPRELEENIYSQEHKALNLYSVGVYAEGCSSYTVSSFYV